MSSSSESSRITGVVKWFNNKNGYGFITVCDEDPDVKDKEVFVHYSSIRVTNDEDRYRYLVAGEYVEFYLTKASKDNHEIQAMDVTGIKGGPIMCERQPQGRYTNSRRGGEGPIAIAPPRVGAGEDVSTGPTNAGFQEVHRKRAPARQPRDASSSTRKPSQKKTSV